MWAGNNSHEDCRLYCNNEDDNDVDGGDHYQPAGPTLGASTRTKTTYLASATTEPKKDDRE